MSRKPFYLLVALALMASLTASVHATKLVALTDDELIDQADAILTGRSVAAESEWRGKMLMTAVSIEVGDVLKGGQAAAAGARITVLVPGGIDRDRPVPISVVFPGAPSIASGEDLLLFLTSGGEPGSFFVTGLSQGKFSLAENAAGETVVYRDLGGVELVDDSGTRRGGRAAGTLARVKERLAQRLAETNR